MRRMPPLGAIEAFMVGARSRSFRAAAAELALSPSAFSRRIQLLEAFVGIALFDRSGPTPVLTAAGMDYRLTLEEAVETIRSNTEDLRLRGARSTVRIGASMSVAATWLLPRLPTFTDAHPGLAVEIAPAHGIEEVRSGKVDVAIFGGTAPPNGTDCIKLIDIEAAPVAAPRWLERHGRIDGLASLAQASLIGFRRPADIWDRWLARVGYAGEAPELHVRHDTILMSYEAAAAGLGVTLGAPFVAERFLRDGRLVPCYTAPVPIGISYYAAFAAGPRRQAVRDLTTWLQREVRKSRADLFGMLSVPHLHHSTAR